MKIKKLEILAFAQGSADCICAIINNNVSLLIDCGKAYCYDNVINKLKDNNIEINYMIITHNHRDHLGGFNNFISELKKSTKFRGIIFWMSEYSESSPLTKSVIDTIIDNKITYYSPADNNSKSILFNENIKILSPMKGESYDYNNINRNSIIITFKISDKYIVLTGDATEDRELEIIRHNEEVIKNAVVIKLGHHGSDTSSNWGYITTINKANIKKVLCCCRENWTNKPPNVNKINEVESELAISVTCTGRNNERVDIRTICKINKKGKLEIDGKEI